MKSITSLFGLSLLVFLLIFSTNAAANPVFSPAYVAIDSDNQTLYSLEVQEITILQQTLRKYRLWKSTLHSVDRSLVSWLGTKVLPRKQKIVGMTWDSVHKRLLFVDGQAKHIFAIDAHSYRRSLVSGTKKGDGEPFQALGSVVIDQLNNRLIVIDKAEIDKQNQRVLTQVDLATGDRAVYYAAANDDLSAPHSIAFDPYSLQLFLSYGRGILVFNMHADDPRVISDAQLGQGGGPGIVRGEQIAFDFNRYQLLITEPLFKRVMAVDVATGQRSIVVAANADAGPSLCWPGAVAIEDDFAIIADAGHQAWLQLNLANNLVHRSFQTAKFNNSACTEQTVTEVKQLALRAISDFAKGLQESRDLSPENFSYQSANITTEQWWADLGNDIANFWRAVFEPVFQAISFVATWTLGPIFAAGLLLAIQFYYLYFLFTAPAQLVAWFVFGPQAITVQYQVMNSILAASFGLPLGLAMLTVIVGSAALAGLLTVPYIPYAILQSLFELVAVPAP